MNKELERIVKAVFYSVDGLKDTIKTEAAFRQELILSAIFIPLAFFLDVSDVERILMVSSIVLVLIVELINSAIEAVVDRISLEQHALSKKAKDTGSAVVLLAFLNAVVVWVLILI